MPPFTPRRTILTVALAGVAACAVAAGGSRAAVGGETAGPQCGGVLWRLMTLSDPQRHRVDLHGKWTTISDIAARKTPARIAPVRNTGFQRRVWKMRAVVDRYRIASNGEIVLVLYSIDSGRFMDAYLPARQSLGERARNRTGMLAARHELTSRCPQVRASWQLLGITVDVGGVGYWNPTRVTRGALPNGAELRPVTNFKIVTGCGIG